MPYGVGGLIGDLLHPDLNAQLGRAISPTPNPLPGATPPGPNAPPGPTGGQGQGSAAPAGQGPTQTSNVSPINLPAPDPVNQKSIGELILNAQRERDAEQGFNYGMQQIAAGFGTAEQQASKQANLRNYPQSGDNLVQQLSGIQGIQQTQFENQQKQNALAAMLNPQLFKDLQGYGYSPAEITALAYSGKLPELLTTIMGVGGDATMQAMNHDRMIWIQQHQAKDAQGNPLPGQYVGDDGKPTTVPNELINFEKYKLKLAADTQKTKEVTATQGNFQPALQGYNMQIDNINKLLDPANKQFIDEFVGPFQGKIRPVADMSPQAQALYKIYQTVMASQFSASVQDFPGSRISTKELQSDAPSKSSMDIGQGLDSFLAATDQYRDQLLNHRTNLFGKAQQLSNPSLSDAEYDKYMSDIYKPGQDLGPKIGAVNRPTPVPVASAANVLNLPAGRAFVLPDGTKGYAVHNTSDVALLPHGAAYVVPDGSGRIGHAP